jgi:phage terminase large subunit GpA-like protein
VTEWAETNRNLPQTASEPGRYRASRCPYQAGIQDAVNDPLVRQITVVAAERVGKSTIAANILGYLIDRRPCGVLWVMPNQMAMTDFVRDEIEPMVEGSVRLRKKVGAGTYHEGGNSVRRKSFEGGFVTFVGGGSPTNIAFRTVKVAVIDETDKLKTLPREGDADTLIAKRVSTFSDSVVLRFSKPTTEDGSRIWRHYLRGTQSRYWVPCPGCGEYQLLKWAQLHFDDARMRCSHCDGRFDQDSWLSSGAGEWRETQANAGHKSFQISSLYSPFIRWETLIEEFRAANDALEMGDTSLLQVFINSRLGEPFGGVAQNKMEPTTLYSRREYFGASDVPAGIIGVTLGVDTQSDRFIWLLCGWGRRNEVWMLATGEIMGDMASDEPWSELEALIDRLWFDGQGNAYRPLVSCIDVQGDSYQHTVAFCKALAWKKVRGVRGLGIDKRRSTSAGVSIIRNVYMDKTLRVPIQNLDTDAAKTMVSTMLARGEPGPGYVHFPAGENEEDVRGFNLESLSEFTAEYRTKKVISGYPIYSWHKFHGRATHRLDCFVYALAGALLSHVKFDSAEPQRIPKPKVEAHMKKMEESKKEQSGDAHKTPYGVQPGTSAVPWPSQWGVQSQVVQPEERAVKRPWGAQPQSNIF